MRRMVAAAADPEHAAHDETALRRRLDKALATHAARAEAAKVAAKDKRRRKRPGAAALTQS